MLKRIIKTIKNNIPILSKILNQRNTLLKERDFLKEEIKKASNKLNLGLFPPGHFYSPIPDLRYINPLNYKNSTVIDLGNKDIDFNEKEQINLIKQFKNFYPPPFPEKKNKKFRYYYINPNFSYGDAISLYSMIRFLKPNKIIEIGAGFSSCLMLDTNENYFKNKIQLLFIEPYPDLLFSLIKPTDYIKIKLLKKNYKKLITKFLNL